VLEGELRRDEAGGEVTRASNIAATALVALLLTLPGPLPVLAADYPKKPDDKDKLCEVMGEESPNITISPQDRLWFKENCKCVSGPTILIDDEHGGIRDTGNSPSTCGSPGSKRFTRRVNSLAEGNQKLVSLVKTKSDQWTAMQSIRDAYWKCLDATIPPGVEPPAGQTRWCAAEIDALESACAKSKLIPTECWARSMPFRLPPAVVP
jgi:hypothetical protein